MIQATLIKQDDEGNTNNIGGYEFLCLPRIGEVIEVPEGGSMYRYTVIAIAHQGLPPADQRGRLMPDKPWVEILVEFVAAW